MEELAFVSAVWACSGVFIVSAFIVGIVVGVVVTKRRWRKAAYRRRIIRNW